MLREILWLRCLDRKVKYVANDTLPVRFKRLAEWFTAHFMNYEGSEQIDWLDTVSQLIDYSMSDPEHMAKMTAGIMPVFDMLIEKPLNELLSLTRTQYHQEKL